MNGSRRLRRTLEKCAPLRLLARFREVRDFSERLCETLEPEDYVVQSMPDVSPTKWHLAHTSWFFETFILKVWMPGYRTAVPQYAFLFNSYYNAAGDMHRRDLRGLISRPTVAETYRFRQSIDTHIGNCWKARTTNCSRKWSRSSQSACTTNSSTRNCLSPTSNTSSRKTRFIPSIGKRDERIESQPIAQENFIEFHETILEIGHDGREFSYDNEGPRHRALVPAFSLATRPVTNGEFIEFIEAGGYQQPEFWLSLGWMTVNEQRWEAPHTGESERRMVEFHPLGHATDR